MVVVRARPAGRGPRSPRALARLDGPVAVVNSDLPCVMPRPSCSSSSPRRRRSSPRADGTTNALSLADARDFRPLYGPGSAERFGLAGGSTCAACSEDVDTQDDLLRLAPRVGPEHRADALLARA